MKYVRLSIVLTCVVSTTALYILTSDGSFFTIFAHVDTHLATSRGNEIHNTPQVKTNLENNRTQTWNPASKNITKTPSSYGEEVLSKFPFLTEHVINPHNYKYVITPTLTCENHQAIELIICVPIRFDNFEGRKTIRETWGSYAKVNSHNSILIFFIGLPEISTAEVRTSQKLVLNESVVYGDILQEDYVDSYNNLSLKSVSILKYVSTYCLKASYILKADDDMYINIPHLVSSLRHMKDIKPNLNLFLIGSKQIKAHPIRSTNSKSYTPISEFPDDTYPDYVSGTAYVMSANASWLLYEASQRVPLFWLEDIYITGMCSKKAGVEVLDSALFSYGKPTVSGCSFRHRVSGHRYSTVEIRRIHRELNDHSIVC
ncbi:beta-1,3-galactosyltransferase 1-like [Physella acuta]|uniref:beta-1,3-galactosyltransferase 1-like n=1 Tax=Physella acuta TaxID=109671 RepID=UPI0027DC6232|nr:beta-1,3-galactosyltransferase 1-like [Physella acuta]